MGTEHKTGTYIELPADIEKEIERLLSINTGVQMTRIDVIRGALDALSRLPNAEAAWIILRAMKR